MRLTLLSITSSLGFLLLGGCSSIQRPDTDLCIVNVQAKHQKCYNLKRDYDDQGALKKDAKATFKPVEKIEDLDKLATTDPKGLANLKAYLQELRDYISDLQKKAGSCSTKAE